MKPLEGWRVENPSKCPACGYLTDTAGGVTSQNAPGVGDLSVCLNCGAFMQFGAGLVLVALSPAEFELLRPDEQTRRAMFGVREYILRRGRLPGRSKR
jgi:hypothetical protein